MKPLIEQIASDKIINKTCRGISLSPLLGALYLSEIDNINKNVTKSSHYIRYMDDWIFLTNNKHILRRYIRKVNQTLTGLKLTVAKNKTFIGRTIKGVDFLGFHFSHDGITVAAATVSKFLEKITAKIHKYRRQENSMQFKRHSWDTQSYGNKWNRFYESGLVRRNC